MHKKNKSCFKSAWKRLSDPFLFCLSEMVFAQVLSSHDQAFYFLHHVFSKWGSFVDCKVGDWKQWCESSATCDGGTKKRAREVSEGASCLVIKETDVCKTDQCEGILFLMILLVLLLAPFRRWAHPIARFVSKLRPFSSSLTHFAQKKFYPNPLWGQHPRAG